MLTYTFLNFIFCLFIFGYAGSFLLHGLSLAAASRGSSLVVVKGLLLLWHMVSRGHRLQQLNCKGLAALWHVRSSQTSIKPIFPALAGRFFTTEPPGKPLDEVFLMLIWKQKGPTNKALCLPVTKDSMDIWCENK